MADGSTITVTQGGPAWTEGRGYLSGTGGIGGSATIVEQKRTHSTVIERTVGFTTYALAETFRDTALTGANVKGTIEKDGDAPYWTVTIETDTIGNWVDV